MIAAFLYVNIHMQHDIQMIVAFLYVNIHIQHDIQMIVAFLYVDIRMQHDIQMIVAFLYVDIRMQHDIQMIAAFLYVDMQQLYGTPGNLQFTFPCITINQGHWLFTARVGEWSVCPTLNIFTTYQDYWNDYMCGVSQKHMLNHLLTECEHICIYCSLNGVTVNYISNYVPFKNILSSLLSTNARIQLDDAEYN